MTVLAALALALSLACSRSSGPERSVRDEISADTSAEGMLERAAEALRQVESVRYDFRYGDINEPTGFATGTTWMKRIDRLDDSWIRVEGTLHAQPRFGVETERFVYATDGESAWSQSGSGEAEVAVAGRGNNRLSARGVYGFLPEFVEAEPLWRELAMSERVEWEGRERVGGVECDVVRVEIPLDAGEASSIVWWFGAEDHLPRRGRWISERSGPRGVTFELSGLEVGVAIAGERFQAPDDVRVAEAAIAVGERVPDWSLPRPDGTTLHGADLRGEVVVLDFWNTWCPICRSIAPSTHELARSYLGRPVRFFGVNLLEQNDPVAYWNEVEPPYPLLLSGEDLAKRLDLPWQPGVAVIGPDGDLLHKQFGASADRIERLRTAIDRGLQRTSSGAQ